MNAGTTPQPPTIQPISATFNETAVTVEVDPLTPLADVLRNELSLTGTKLGCRAGDCGSCTVLVNQIPIVSCLMPIAHVDGAAVTTIEGLTTNGALHAVQEALHRRNASQCGYCIPGIVMAAVAIVEHGGGPTRTEIVRDLGGNLCRCTGYEAIIDAIADACEGQLVPDEDSQ